MSRPYISESHDNYRQPESAEDAQLLFNYFDLDEIELLKQTFYNQVNEKENI